MIHGLLADGCVAFAFDDALDEVNHGKIDEWAKASGRTVVYCPWHPNPEYRVFKTGTLFSRNEDYPSGLVIVDDKLKTHPWHALAKEKPE